jgi:hypothetical protein
MKEMISRDDVIDLIMKSAPGDYTYDDHDGVYVYNSDINLRLLLDKSDEFQGSFKEPWVSKFTDKDGQRQLVRIYYLATPICKVSCVWVDGYRHLIPVPRSKDTTIDSFKYKIGSILNYPLPFQGFDQALQQAGIKTQGD